MPLKKRLSDPFWVCSIEDEELDKIPVSNMEKYEITRDIDCLELDKYDSRPTLVRCDPLKPEYDDRASIPTANDQKLIFSAHVNEIKNYDSGLDIRFKVENGKKRLESKSIDEIPYAFLAEIAQVIIFKGVQLDTRPFTTSGIWSSVRLHRTRKRRVMNENAPTDETAN